MMIFIDLTRVGHWIWFINILINIFEMLY